MGIRRRERNTRRKAEENDRKADFTLGELRLVCSRVSGRRSVLSVYLPPPSGAAVSLSWRRMTSFTTARQRLRIAALNFNWIKDLKSRGFVISFFLSKGKHKIPSNSI